MIKRKKISREEYMKKFKTQFEKLNYIPQEGEVIVQCGEGYPNYWFVSNKGYLFSAYYRNLKVIKPNFDHTNKPNKEGIRTGNVWRVTMNGKESSTKFTLAKIVADCFCKNEFRCDEVTETHHIKKRASFAENEPQKSNQKENLQILPKSIHTDLTHYAGKTFNKLDKEFEKSNCPVYHVQQNQLNQLAVQAVNSCLEQEMELVMYTMTLADDPLMIESEAHPINGILNVSE